MLALEAGRPDVAQTWILAAYADIRAKDVRSWSEQPMGRSLLCTLVSHHARYEDVQVC